MEDDERTPAGLSIPHSFKLVCQPRRTLKIRKAFSQGFSFGKAHITAGVDYDVQKKNFTPQARFETELYNVCTVTASNADINVRKQMDINIGPVGFQCRAQFIQNYNGKASFGLEFYPRKFQMKLFGAGLSIARGDNVEINPKVLVPRLLKRVELQVVSSTYRGNNGSQQCYEVEEFNPIIIL